MAVREKKRRKKGTEGEKHGYGQKTYSVSNGLVFRVVVRVVFRGGLNICYFGRISDISSLH